MDWSGLLNVTGLGVDMAEKLSANEVDELIKLYPTLLVLRESDDKNIRSVTAISCGPGWKNLISSLLTSMQRYIDYANRYTDVPVEQIKIQYILEKAGSLRVYYTGFDTSIDAMIAVTCEISKTICEISGAPGSTYAKDGWFKTLSPEIAAMLGYELDQRASDSELGAGMDAAGVGAT